MPNQNQPSYNPSSSTLQERCEAKLIRIFQDLRNKQVQVDIDALDAELSRFLDSYLRL